MLGTQFYADERNSFIKIIIGEYYSTVILFCKEVLYTK